MQRGQRETHETDREILAADDRDLLMDVRKWVKRLETGQHGIYDCKVAYVTFHVGKLLEYISRQDNLIFTLKAGKKHG